MADYRSYPPVFDKQLMWKAVEEMNRYSDTIQAKTAQTVMRGYKVASDIMGYSEPMRMVQTNGAGRQATREGLVERQGAAIVHQDV